MSGTDKKRKDDPGDGLSQPVYSTETGDLRKSGLGGSLSSFLGNQAPVKPAGGGGGFGGKGGGGGGTQKKPVAAAGPRKLTVRLEKKGRGGKTVTIIENYTGSNPSRDVLARDLKSHCGTGGSLEDDGTILIQGDQRQRVAEYLRKIGLNPSVSG